MQTVYWCFIGSFYGYLVALLSARGYSGTEIGFLTSLMTAGFLVGQTAMGAIADATRKNRRLYILCCACSFAAWLALYLSGALWQAAAALFCLGLFKEPSICMLDSWIIKRFEGDTGRYGKIRSCGSIAYAVFMLLYGFLLDAVGYGLMPIAAGILLGLCVITALSVPELKREDAKARARQRLLPTLKKTMTPLLAVSFALFFLMGLCVLPVYSFIPVSMEEVGGGAALLGVLYFINASMEFTLMRCTFLARRFHTYGRLLLCSGLYVLSTLTVALAGSPAVLIAGMAINGAAYGLQLPARREIVARRVPERFQTTVHGVMDMLYSGFGAMAGNAIVGAAFDAGGNKTAMLLLCALQCAVALIAALATFMSRGAAPGHRAP